MQWSYSKTNMDKILY